MMSLSAKHIPVVLLLSSTLAGCPQREVSRIDPVQAKEQEKRIPVEINRDLDILIVMDNSGSMAQEQDSLAANFPNFINILQTIEGGLPNVHIGVVSTDVGANTAIGGCEQPNGDNGVLQGTRGDGVPQGENCPTPDDIYISDVSDGTEEGGRIINYPDGELSTTFSCIARLGTGGCGFEQPLEAMYRALDNDGPNAANQGFLRPSAFLAVIFITDEDDCSASNPDLFDNRVESVPALGPLSSYRCFEFGVQCNPDDRTQVGPRVDCVPRQNSPYVYDVQRYIDFVKSLKDDPGLVITAAITGVSAGTSRPEPVAVGENGEGNPELAAVCESAGLGRAAPAVRLSAFLDAFPGRNTVTTICQNDLSGALQQVAELLKEVVGNPCLEGEIKLDKDDRPLCTVADVPSADDEEEVLIRACSSPENAVAEAPCWYVETNPECAGENNQTMLALTVERADTVPPVGTFIEVRCATN